MRSHGVAPWIYKLTRDRPDLVLPDKISGELKADYYNSSAQSIHHESCLRRLAESLANRQIPMVVLKGIYLSEFVYRNPALRLMSDVDILVKEEDLGCTQELLTGLGFKLAIDVPEEFQPHLYPSRPYLRSGASREVLDLHSRLVLLDHYHLSSETVWKNSLEAEIFGFPVRILTPEMNFIHIAVHIPSHSPILRDRLDLLMILLTMKPNWNTILDLSGDLGVMRPLYWITRELIDDWDCEIPSSVNEAFRSYKAPILDDLVIKSRFRYFWRFYSRFSRQQGFDGKLKFLRLRLFPSPEYRKAVVGSSNPVYYIHSKLSYFLNLYKRN